MVQEETRQKLEIDLNQDFHSDRGSSIIRYLKFLFIPRSRLRQLNIEIIIKNDLNKNKTNRNWLKSPLTVIGIILVIIVITVAVFDVWLAPYTFKEATSTYFQDEWLPPSPEHPLGTGDRGQDVLSRIIYGTRYSLIISFASVGISIVFGILLGLISGYYGGWIDTITMGIIDIVMAFPGLIFAMAILAIWGSSIEKMILILGIIGIPFYSRLMRAAVLRIKEMEYITSARVVGARNRRILFRHILPNSFEPILISISFDIGRLIISVAILSFLGFSDYRIILWGENIINANIWQAPWVSLSPSVAIVLTALGFMLLGDGLRDTLDPKYHYKSI